MSSPDLCSHIQERPSIGPGYSNTNALHRVRLVYYGRYTGHVLGDKEVFQHLSISSSVRDAILALVEQGLGTRAIKDKLALCSNGLYTRLQDGTLTRDDLVTSSDVYNISMK